MMLRSATILLTPEIRTAAVFIYPKAREDKGDREGILHTHPIP